MKKTTVLAVLVAVATVSTAQAEWSFGPRLAFFKSTPKGYSEAGAGVSILSGGKESKPAVPKPVAHAPKVGVTPSFYQPAAPTAAACATAPSPAAQTQTFQDANGTWVIQKASAPGFTMVAVPNDKLDAVPAGSVNTGQAADVK